MSERLRKALDSAREQLGKAEKKADDATGLAGVAAHFLVGAAHLAIELTADEYDEPDEAED